MAKQRFTEADLITHLGNIVDNGVRPRGLVTGVGDDAAIFRGPRDDYVVTKDVQVENRHFSRKWLTPREIGWRLAAVNLSDVAAMGARPLYGLLSFVIPDSTSKSDIMNIERGVVAHLARYGAAVIGGNVSGGSGPLVCDMTLIGSCGRARAWTRAARKGDAVVVVGELGNAAAGLAQLKALNPAPKSKLATAFKRPLPMIEVAAVLRNSKKVHAAIDVSDGFSTDLIHMCDMGAVGVEIDRDRLPISRALILYCRKAGLDPLDFAMQGGEDYALILSVEAKRAEQVCDLVTSRTDARARIVGHFIKGQTRTLLTSEGQRTAITPSGWDHFG